MNEILSDAIQKYIEAEHRIIKIKRYMIGELFVILCLMVFIIARCV